MSVSRKLYSCRFAPNGENPLHAIRVSQRCLYRGEIVSEAFAPQAFAGMRGSETPILLDHDESNRAGTVTVMIAHGDWHIADFLLDGPYASRAAEWIEGSGKVSPGFTAIDKDPISAREPCPMNWYTRARLDEISILPPGAIEWYQGAKVTRISELPKLEPKDSPAVRTTTSDRAAGEQVIYGDGTRVRRYFPNAVLAVGGKPLLRTSSGQAIRREGRDYVIDHEDGSQTIYSGAEGYRGALRDGTLRVR